MRRLLLPALFLLLPSLAQSVRSLGMAGVLLPGPEASYLNPAYTAYPASTYGAPGGFTLPLGFLGLLRNEANPFRYFTDPQGFKDPQSGFDLLSFYDQFNHLNEFLINPARSPDKVVFNISADTISVTDGAGRPLNLGFAVGNGGAATAGSLTPSPLFRLPFRLSPELYLDFGVFAGVGGFSLDADAKLKALLASGNIAANETYGVIARGNGEAGLSLGFGYATPLPPLPDFEGKVYVGARGEAFYGLAYTEVEGTASITTDSNKVPSATQYSGKVFYSIPGNGSGWGLRADVGVAVDLKEGTFGLGVRNALGFAHWSGQELSFSGSGSPSAPSSRNKAGFSPGIFLNGASKQPLELGTLLIGGDLVYEGSLAVHVGVEYALEGLRLRTGLGYEGGLKFGLGAGYAGPGFTLDAALTTHQAPVVGGMVFGIALGFGLDF